MPEPKPHQIDLTPPDDIGVARLRFVSGRPLNTMTLPLVEDLLSLTEMLAGRADVRVLMIEGSPQAFSGGADLATMSTLGLAGYQHYIHTEFALFAAIDVLPFITAAVVNGPCLGNAAELALACDFRLASRTSVFGLAETRVGFQGPTQRITQYVPMGIAKDLLYRGRILDADESLRFGLVSEVAEPDDLLARSVTFAAELAALPPVAIRETKRNIAAAYAAARSGDEADIRSSVACFHSEDFREGVAAFFAKRPAAFAGR
jgi:enoyl-CoA hydratase/carnithine racemase